MKLEVRHSTRYTYDPPLHGVIQLHRLTPSTFAGQSVLDWSVTCPGAQNGARYRDGAGDVAQLVSIRGEVSEVEVHVEGRVETFDTAGVLRDHRERVPPSVYLRSSVQTKADEPLRALAADTLAGIDPGNALGRAHALMNAVADAVAYEPGRTEASTTAAEALEIGAGVCQDHAHVLIALAHRAGIPARYANGYLNASDDGTLHEAAHAWAELYLPDLGWVGFDPSNRCCPNEHYIRLGSGFDALDAAPIRGVSTGASSEEMDVSVSVQAQQ